MATLSEDGSEYGVDEELRRDLRSLRAVLEEEGRQSGSGLVCDGDVEEPNTVIELQKLLDQNHKLQFTLLEQLGKIETLLSKNRAKKLRLASITKGPKRLFNLWRFKKGPYFRDHKGENPTCNMVIKTQRDKSAEVFYVRENYWRVEKEEKKLLEGIREQTIGNLTLPLQNQLRLAKTTKEANRLKRQIWETQTRPNKDLLRDVGDIDWDMLVYEKFGNQRSSRDCQLHWENYLNPAVNCDPFTKEDDKQLLRLVMAHDYTDWEMVAKEMNNQRTAIACLKRYQRSLNPTFFKSEWSPEEDKVLREGVAKYGVKNWKSVAMYVGRNRTSQQCLHRWYNSLRPGIKKGRWDEAEDEQLQEAVRQFGAGNWAKISVLVPMRTAVQCRERWVNVHDSKLKRGAWSKEEDEKLKRICQEFSAPFPWSKVAARMGNRTDSMCSLRWHLLSPTEDIVIQYASRAKKRESIMNNFHGRRNRRSSLSAEDLEDDLIPQATKEKLKSYETKIRMKKMRQAEQDAAPSLAKILEDRHSVGESSGSKRKATDGGRVVSSPKKARVRARKKRAGAYRRGKKRKVKGRTTGTGKGGRKTETAVVPSTLPDTTPSDSEFRVRMVDNELAAMSVPTTLPVPLTVAPQASSIPSPTTEAIFPPRSAVTPQSQPSSIPTGATTVIFPPRSAVAPQSQPSSIPTGASTVIFPPRSAVAPQSQPSSIPTGATTVIFPPRSAVAPQSQAPASAISQASTATSNTSASEVDCYPNMVASALAFLQHYEYMMSLQQHTMGTPVALSPRNTPPLGAWHPLMYQQQHGMPCSTYPLWYSQDLSTSSPTTQSVNRVSTPDTPSSLTLPLRPTTTAPPTATEQTSDNPISVAVQALLDIHNVPMEETVTGSPYPISGRPRYTMSPMRQSDTDNSTSYAGSHAFAQNCDPAYTFGASQSSGTPLSFTPPPYSSCYPLSRGSPASTGSSVPSPTASLALGGNITNLSIIQNLAAMKARTPPLLSSIPPRSSSMITVQCADCPLPEPLKVIEPMSPPPFTHLVAGECELCNQEYEQLVLCMQNPLFSPLRQSQPQTQTQLRPESQNFQLQAQPLPQSNMPESLSTGVQGAARADVRSESQGNDAPDRMPIPQRPSVSSKSPEKHYPQGKAPGKEGTSSNYQSMDLYSRVKERSSIRKHTSSTTPQQTSPRKQTDKASPRLQKDTQSAPSRPTSARKPVKKRKVSSSSQHAQSVSDGPETSSSGSVTPLQQLDKERQSQSSKTPEMPTTQNGSPHTPSSTSPEQTNMLQTSTSSRSPGKQLPSKPHVKQLSPQEQLTSVASSNSPSPQSKGSVRVQKRTDIEGQDMMPLSKRKPTTARKTSPKQLSRK